MAVRAVALLLLAVYTVATFGLLPSSQTMSRWFGRVSGDRYPCEASGCGCAGSQQCWTVCRCHTLRERLVWAIENGVLPPENLYIDDADWIAAANAVKPGSAHCEMCVDRIKNELKQGIATVGVRQVAVEQGSCCERGACDTGSRSMLARACASSHKPEATCSTAASCCSTATKAETKPAIKQSRLSLSAMTCKGLSQVLSLCLPVAPAVKIDEIIIASPTPFVPLFPADAAWESRVLDTTEPPPRLSPRLA
jgi:hypothetical protein